MSAPVSVIVRRGESPLQACTLRPVTESNCVSVRRGGKQLEVNEQSVVKRTRFGRSDWRASSSMAKPRKSVALRGCVRKRRQKRSGGWGRNARKDGHVKQGGLSGIVSMRSFRAMSSFRATDRSPSGCSCLHCASRRARRSGVRASIVVMKPGNAGGAKGRRKTDA